VESLPTTIDTGFADKGNVTLAQTRCISALQFQLVIKHNDSIPNPTPSNPYPNNWLQSHRQQETTKKVVAKEHTH
jgi:hypothetical protein